MLSQLLTPILVGAAIYIFLPKSENVLLVLFQLKSTSLSGKEINSIGNIKYSFKIDRNMDGHMGVDTTGRDIYNFAVITEHFPTEDLSLKFTQELEKNDVIQSFQAFPFSTSPLETAIINMQISFKRLFYDIAPSLANIFPSLDIKLTPLDKKKKEEEAKGIDELCREESKSDEPFVMINVGKVKDLEVVKKYGIPVFFNFFPVINTRIFIKGKARSDYWEDITLIKYPNIASLCRMANSKEFIAVLPYKVAGLQDSLTYLSYPV